MDKFVNESLDDFLVERSWGDADNPGGPIRNAAKAIRSAPARALRRKRARKIMQKYKTKITNKIDEILTRYTKNLDTIELKIQDRLDRVNASSVPDDAKSNQYEDILEDLRSSMEGVLKSARDTANEYVKTYADSFDKRLERPGTITGAEFMPEDKTDLLAEWKGIESEINYYIETKLLDFIDYISVEGLSEIKAALKQFIENQKGYYHGFSGGHISEVGTLGSTEMPVYNHFDKIVGGTLDTPMLITTPLSFPENKAGSKYVQFIIDKGQMGYQFMEKSGRKTGQPFVPISKFFPIDSSDFKDTFRKIVSVTNII